MNCAPKFPLYSTWTASPLKMGPVGCPETSVKPYSSKLRKIPKDHRFNLHRGASLKSRACVCMLRNLLLQ
jgi:hypothetical protein